MGKQTRRTREPKQFKHRVICVFDKGDDVGFMYTVGLHPQKWELAAVEVPREDVEDLCSLMNFLSGRELANHETAQSKKNYIYYIRDIHDLPPYLHNHFMQHSFCQMDPHAKVFFLQRAVDTDTV